MDMHTFHWEHCLQVLVAHSFPVTVASLSILLALLLIYVVERGSNQLYYSF